MTRSRLFAVLAVAYVALAILANWLAATYFWTVPFTNLVAPGGVFAIGAVLVLRDWMQQLRGLAWTMPLVYVAGIVSYLVAEVAGWTDLQRIAVASLVAFTVSETVEAIIFSPFRRRSPTAGVLLSGIAGNALDSYVFLAIAFGSLGFFRGQFVGKGEMILVGVALTALRRTVTPVPAVEPA